MEVLSLPLGVDPVICILPTSYTLKQIQAVYLSGPLGVCLGLLPNLAINLREVCQNRSFKLHQVSNEQNTAQLYADFYSQYKHPY